MARTTKYTEERAATILESIRQGMTYRLAAASAGITDDTLTAWKKRHSDFSERLARAEAEAVETALRQIRSAAKMDWRAAAWILEHRHPEDFGRQAVQRHEHVGDAEQPLQVVVKRVVSSPAPDTTTEYSP